MGFAHLVLRNLLRARVRSALTLIGISLGITTIVALGVITAGFKSTAGAFVQSGGADFMVAQEGAADMSFSTIPEAAIPQIAAVEGVESVRGGLFHFTRVGSNPFFLVLGVLPGDLSEDDPPLVEGRHLAPDSPAEIVLGVQAAAELGVSVGGEVVIDERAFEVVGIVDSEVLWEQSGALAPLPTVQDITNRREAVSVVHVSVVSGADPEAVARRVEEQVAGVVSIVTAGDIGKVDSGFQILDAANAAISGLAIVIGGIGVMNTMVMSIFERTREIGVLRAVGWSGWRVLRMILIEALMLCLAAAAMGSLVGLLAVQAVMRVPAVRGLLEPSYEPGVFVQAFLVAIGVALIGAVYPAIRATRLTPMEALRYE
ncbi:MAG: ABC transporter permease [Dehalococcoidia bacterium]